MKHNGDSTLLSSDIFGLDLEASQRDSFSSFFLYSYINAWTKALICFQSKKWRFKGSSIVRVCFFLWGLFASENHIKVKRCPQVDLFCITFKALQQLPRASGKANRTVCCDVRSSQGMPRLFYGRYKRWHTIPFITPTREKKKNISAKTMYRYEKPIFLWHGAQVTIFLLV